ncbi:MULTISPECIES: ArnT family glycosyltransferase [Bacillus amyloliquefaciens group]|uniref:ArnT family glycosyltransferase n=1 Tax=Bacillus amyloliquefaciens group TaxID=1938374 RepID=UPI0006A84C8C|nr:MULTISPECIES: glycosyltransferase family 39 protein [Bacillus amyloliquefaciens group]MCG1014830.1 glycosyltransferase family 39 protein [Bacillus velezensis]MCR6606361.1 glycosyltransferase family 39 protein [Bacillus velezensis]MEC0406045.1 glycosyltransferase family 39 protein [Bacillus velezensis]WFP04681.1 glycosyltransferase family 39 protein [Bacillus velezensis]CUB30069.1 Dolichyl-phosphate-mannose-protein mannosyltransferase [Bacillus amyloliquefaciens]
MKMKKREIDAVLILILLASAFLNMYNIWNDDTVNPYYTAAVTSMLQSFHNFFYASFDAAGFITVDKPPVTYQIQTISALIFGMHGWSVILPQALAGVGSVLFMYLLIKPTFGKTAARIASFVMACTPIAVAVARTNNVDALLVFFLLFATWLLFKAIRKGRLIWLLAAFFVVGAGFNTKMLQAYMILPAFLLFYMIAANTTIKKKIISLVSALAVLAAVSLSWPLIVDNIPASKRPYVGSSQTNSVLELAFGYNGIQRLTGQSSGGGQGGPDGNASKEMSSSGGSSQMQKPPGQSSSSSSASGDKSQNGSMTAPPSNGKMPSGGEMPSGGQGGPPSGGDGGGGGPGGGGKSGAGTGSKMQSGSGMFGTGTPGPLRLFQTELSDQISWLLPFAIFGMAGLLIAGARERRRLSAEQKETIFWAAWLVPIAGFFSVAEFFHHYYLIMLAPPIAALVGAGWVALVHLYRKQAGWKTWLLPAAILVTTGFELFILRNYNDQIGAGWSIGVGVIGAVAAIALFVFKQRQKPLSYYVSLAALLVLMVMPIYWASTPLLYGGNSSLPETGPQLASTSGKGMGMDNASVNTKLINYLEKHNAGADYLFATTDSNTAAPYIIKTKKAVMAIGGYSGSDPAITLAQFKKLVKEGKVKYFLASGMGKGGNNDIVQWVEKNGKKVSSDKWQSNTDQKTKNSDAADKKSSKASGKNSRMSGGPGGMNQSASLYELQSDE